MREAERTPAIHTTEVHVRWGDQDALGHVNNARYFTYLEQARLEWLGGLADGAAWPEANGSGPILARAEIDYRRPVVYPATLRIDTRAGRVGRTSFTLRSEIRRVDSDVLVADAAVVVVWVDASGRPMPVPDVIRAALESS